MSECVEFPFALLLSGEGPGHSCCSMHRYQLLLPVMLLNFSRPSELPRLLCFLLCSFCRLL